MIQMQARAWGSVDTAPVAWIRIPIFVEPVVVGIKRTANTKPVILLAGKDHASAIHTLGKQLGTVADFDSRTF